MLTIEQYLSENHRLEKLKDAVDALEDEAWDAVPEAILGLQETFIQLEGLITSAINVNAALPHSYKFLAPQQKRELLTELIYVQMRLNDGFLGRIKK